MQSTTYNKIRKLGTGGYGIVWLCKDEFSTFALKELRTNVDEDDIRRFQREARILSSLDHPNIVRVTRKSLSELPYSYAMPHYRTSLRKEVESLTNNKDRIPTIFKSVLDGIGYAHTQGIIHRDLKPENILLNNDSDVVVSDFGLGRILDADTARQTMTGFYMGTFNYMPPEQFEDAKRADERSDIFSLGRILYELYSGAPLTAPQNLTLLSPGVAQLVDRCTQHEPGRRFPSCEALQQSWVSLYNLSERDQETAELIRLRSEGVHQSDGNVHSAERILELLTKYASDEDLLCETFMLLTSEAVTQMYRINPVATKRLLLMFASFVSGQSWPFEYTDDIAIALKRLYPSTTSLETRAEIIFALLRIGLWHNRWFVLRAFSDTLLSVTTREEAHVIAERLKEIDEDDRRNAASYLSINKLYAPLRAIFAFKS